MSKSPAFLDCETADREVVQVPRLSLRPKEAARALGISERLLWTLTARGVIPRVKLGSTVVYPIIVIEKYLADEAAKSMRGSKCD